jgi:hypothetical protein
VINLSGYETKQITQTTRFEGTVQNEIFDDFPKRENDRLVRERVIVPFVKNNRLQQLNMMTLPGCAPIWEYDLRSEDTIKHVPMRAVLVERDKQNHAILKQTIGKNLDYQLENLRKQKGGSEHEYQLDCKLMPPRSIERAAADYQIMHRDSPLDLVYADCCGIWSDYHLRLCEHLTRNPETTSNKFLLGFTVSLTRRQYGCKASNEIEKVLNGCMGANEPADNVSTVFSAQIKNEDAYGVWYGVNDASHMLKRYLIGCKSTLSYAGVYRRGANTHNLNSMMATLWFTVEK